MNTKVELGYNKVARVKDIADFAGVLFPHNRRHQRTFMAIFVELKHAPDQTLASLDWIADQYHISRRVFEIVRAKMRRLGIIDHISRFSARLGYREGWVFSSRFRRSLSLLADIQKSLSNDVGGIQERKDRDQFRYL